MGRRSPWRCAARRREWRSCSIRWSWLREFLRSCSDSRFRELQRGCALRDYNVTEHSSLHLTMDLDGGRNDRNWLRYLATRALTHKKICRKCYGRLSPNATRCHKVKCGRTSDIRTKRLRVGNFWSKLNRPYSDSWWW